MKRVRMIVKLARGEVDEDTDVHEDGGDASVVVFDCMMQGAPGNEGNQPEPKVEEAKIHTLQERTDTGQCDIQLTPSSATMADTIVQTAANKPEAG
jgi:hypothetical protein